MEIPSKYFSFYKPIIDFLLAIILLLVSSPLIIVISILLFLLQGKVVFSQRRPGYKEKLFTLYKFRTMDEGKIFPFGSFLRRTSLDELPQLFNIISGDMSFVGPRPLFESYLDDYTEVEHQRHTVKPGITGLAQVNGRNAISLKDKLVFDVEYVQNQSFLLDLKILLKTIVQLFRFQEADYHSNILNKA